MGFFDWFSGGNKKEQQMEMGSGSHQMGAASMPMSGTHAEGGMHMQHSGPMSGMTMAKDPVCGMNVDPEKAAATSVYQGTTYHFCAPGCKKAFDANPTMYLGQSKRMENGMHRGCC